LVFYGIPGVHGRYLSYRSHIDFDNHMIIAELSGKSSRPARVIGYTQKGFIATGREEKRSVHHLCDVVVRLITHTHTTESTGLRKDIKITCGQRRKDLET